MSLIHDVFVFLVIEIDIHDVMSHNTRYDCEKSRIVSARVNETDDDVSVKIISLFIIKNVSLYKNLHLRIIVSTLSN